MGYMLKHIENRAIAEFIRYGNQSMLFGLGEDQEKIHDPQTYGLKGFEALTIQSHDSNRTPIGLWYKLPTDATKPIYIAFHGRGGSWASKSKSPSKENDEGDRRRLKWLKEMADSGAGVIAVHTRGFGLSKTNETPKGLHLTGSSFINESKLKKDMEAVVDFLKEKKIKPQQTIVTGESLGGALAAMMAETMNETMHKPPAVLGMVNSFASMKDAALDMLKHGDVLRKYARKYDEEHSKSGGWYLGKNIPMSWIPEKLDIEEGTLDSVLKAKSIQLNTGKRLSNMHLDQTQVYIAHAPGDTTVSFVNAEALRRSASRNGNNPLVTFKKLEGDYIEPDCTDPHLNWNPKKIVKDLEGIFNRQRQAIPAELRR